MTEGIKLLRKLQFGREETAGNAVAASTLWRGLGTIQDDTVITEVDEDIGYLSKVDRTYKPQIGASLSLGSVPATFEQLLHILEMGVKTATPSTDGSGSGQVYVYDFPTTAANTIKTYTIEGGDNIQAEEMEYSFVESFTLEGNTGEALMMSAEVRGRQVTNTSFTGAVSVPTVEEILMSKGKLYIDAVDGTAGTTQVSNTLLSCTVNANTGLRAQYTAEGQLYFSFTKNIGPEVTMSVTFEHNSSAVSEKTNWRNETARLIRLEFEGSALTTSDTYTNKLLRIDMAGKWMSFDAISDQEGNDVVTATFKAFYNSTAAEYVTITLVNELASVP